MSVYDSSFGKLMILPPAAREFLRRRLIQAGGVTLFGAGILYLLALLSFRGSDPSLNNATGAVAENLLGTSGAIVADLALQSLGLAALFLSAVLMAWGWRLLRGRQTGRWWLRLVLLPAATIT
ncbi:MAG: DNA translocase FtsK 4TM domain-containing protein, partial [Dongiaceae bacterium]